MREALKLRQESHMHDPNICVFDLSQSAHRIPSSAPHAEFPDVIVMTAILPGSMFWVAFPNPGAGTEGCQLNSNLVEERPLASEEHLLLQGWPIGDEGPIIRRPAEGSHASARHWRPPAFPGCRGGMDQRWMADQWRFPPYHYKPHFLMRGTCSRARCAC